MKRSRLEKDEPKDSHNGPQEGGGGEGLCLHSQEGQDLCACVAAEELIFNTSSEHQTVDLSNKYLTKDFLRDFLHGCTTHGGQEDHTFRFGLSCRNEVRGPSLRNRDRLYFCLIGARVITPLVFSLYSFIINNDS
jgi:hypothetical protein